jgi:hypothetical protein
MRGGRGWRSMGTRSRSMSESCVFEGRGRVAQGARVGRSARGADVPAMLGRPACRGTRCVRFAHFARTAAASMRMGRAARAAGHPALLGAPHARPAQPAPALPPCAAFAGGPNECAYTPWLAHGSLRGCRRPSADAYEATSSAAPGLARALRAHPCLTRRSCPSAVSEANEASSAAQSRCEQRSAVGPQGRPPRPHPYSGDDRPATATAPAPRHG